ncbi:hypothetical protein SeLEV6574_g00719 [Synchytrium endobioticum]|uniref:Phosphoglycerate mutase n=1 Tax=Synchytrium endobioticum TaxID=286115 RepID=A0A507DGH2_9FUNG|nr:hypothetical protein SeLEV6574_g00719 [Synchytrium endobioticum]
MDPFPPMRLPSRPGATIKRIYLCRHGETAANYKRLLQGKGIDLPLNDRGTVQARSLAERLRNEKVDFIGTSHLKRAKQTAQIIHQHHPRAAWLENEDLAEISWGSWDGTDTSEIETLIQKWDRGDFEAAAPQGESPFAVEIRSVSLLYDLIYSRSENNLVFVLHGRLLRIILSSLLNRNLSKMDSFRHHNCNINILDIEILDTPSSSSPLSLSPSSKNLAIQVLACILDDCSHLTDFLL